MSLLDKCLAQSLIILRSSSFRSAVSYILTSSLHPSANEIADAADIEEII